VKALFLAPHGDDAHIAAAGTMVRLLESRAEVYVATFSNAVESLPKGFPPESVDREFRAASKALAIPEDHLMFEHHAVRRFPEKRQEILDTIHRWRMEFAPDWVFVPSTADLHQDHAVIATEATRAFRRSSSVYGFDMPWNVVGPARLDLFIELSEAHLRKKQAAVALYKSQQGKANACSTPEYAENLARIRGNQINAPYAEAFEVIREVRRVGRGLLE